MNTSTTNPFANLEARIERYKAQGAKDERVRIAKFMADKQDEDGCPPHTVCGIDRCGDCWSRFILSKEAD